MKKIVIFDSTLRDGEQAPGCGMNLREKLEMAKQLERLGVDIIDAGCPISSPDDFDAVKNIAETVKEAAVCAVARPVESDIKRAWEALKSAKFPRLRLYQSIGPAELTRTKPEELVERVASMVRFARGFCADVEFSAEDSTGGDRAFLMRVLDTAVAAGASTICLSDSAGYALPAEFRDLLVYVKNHLQSPNVRISIHCHNDLGMAVANTLECIRGGADQVECTVGGIGERAGNAALEEIVMALYARREDFGCETGVHHREIYRSCKLLSTITGVPIAPNKPIVGANAFAHGSRKQSVSSEAAEMLSPELVGIHQSNVFLDRHTGKEAFIKRVRELGYPLAEQDSDEAFERFQVLAGRKREVDDRDIEALLMGAQDEFRETYRLGSYVINCGTVISATAVVRLIKDTGEEFEHVARGEGPIDAAFKAIDRIVKVTSTLKNWTIQAVTEGEDALGEAVSKIVCNGKLVTGRGLSTDILEASLKSYLNAINKALTLSKSDAMK